MQVEFGTGPQDGIERTELLRALAHERRREVLGVLGDHQRSLGLVELTHQVVEEGENLDRYDAERIYISLYHHHLPRLDDAGLVEYDDGRNTVTITERALAHL